MSAASDSARVESVGRLLARIRDGQAVGPDELAVLETRTYLGLSPIEHLSVVHEIRLSNPSVESVLPFMGNEEVAARFVRLAARRIDAADGAIDYAASDRAFSPPLKFAFGLLTPHHEARFAAAVKEGRLSREDLVACAFDGPELSRRLGEQTVSLPIRFETIEGDLGDVYRGGKTKPSDTWGFDVPHELETRHGRFVLRVSNAIELGAPAP